ncbi:DUF3616 domain-containing protein [Stigmatella aurantiaca]|uniref:Conserved uncharacterized protein n=1 Tax=Stigmatella aurantiaca (strain DW4/3-1) TaxID=378806 RepID=Q08MQ4_STIAD|nr:DUF3616 domain-containing protein [Stigmatella aurantiaca]ADO68635.1 conserved uncharacterized protein [Stigmatella aurantiaca DW4/3-1]EAU61765.1 conserved hypothetical protein [Stigmatella aurantiaca DW4/3-1]
MEAGQLLGRLLLQFDSNAAEVPEDLSAAVRSSDGNLWVAADEAGVVERLTPSEARIYGHHARFHVADFLDANRNAEIDIEALDAHADYLWLVGSHSAKRKKPKGKGVADDIARLATVEHAPERFMLARIPFVNGELAVELKTRGTSKRSHAAARVKPAQGQERDKGRKAPPARTPATRSKTSLPGENLLMELLREDPHFGPFLARPAVKGGGALPIPSKDNGLDIEGLVVTDTDRVFLGLRGPVLRGHSTLLDMRLADAGNGLLEPKPGRHGARYAKHFLDLDGLGIRELCVHGEDLLVLAGPTLPVQAPIRLFRLHKFQSLHGNSLLNQEKGVLEPLFDIPQSGKRDHAEGVANFSYFSESDSVLVVYDDPAPSRRYGPCGVFADIFRLDF